VSTARRHTVDVEGGSIVVHDYGDGEPLLMLHGWALDHRVFDKQIGALGTRYRLLMPDRRGFGRSTAPPGLHHEVDDIIALLDQLGIERCHVLGMSQGGRIALRLAARHPERLASLILQSAALDHFRADASPDDEIPIARYAGHLAAGNIDRVRQHWLAHPMMQVDRDDDRKHLQEILQDCLFRDLENLDDDAYEWADDVRGRLTTLPCPTLIVVGTDDTPSRIAIAAELERCIPRANTARIDGGGHLVNLTHAPEYNQSLEAFLERTAGDQEAALLTE